MGAALTLRARGSHNDEEEEKNGGEGYQTLTEDQKLAKDCDDNFHDFRHIHRQGFNFFQMASFLAVGLMGTKVLLIVLRLWQSEVVAGV